MELLKNGDFCSIDGWQFVGDIICNKNMRVSDSNPGYVYSVPKNYASGSLSQLVFIPVDCQNVQFEMSYKILTGEEGQNILFDSCAISLTGKSNHEANILKVLSNLDKTDTLRTIQISLPSKFTNDLVKLKLEIWTDEVHPTMFYFEKMSVNAKRI